MANKIYIQLYYNLKFTKTLFFPGNDYIEEEQFIITEKSIIIDEKIVKEILKHEKTKINEYGEFIDYDFNFLKKNIIQDLINYKDKDKSSNQYDYEIISFYYIKCDILKDINNEIEIFLNNE